MSTAEVARYLDPEAAVLLQGHPPPRRMLFLDRDGVINKDLGYVHAPQQVEWVEGIFRLCREAVASGYLLVVVTNQAGIARGYYDQAQFLDFTAWMHRQFADRQAPVLATYYCPHHATAGLGTLRVDCACRKPRPGMLLGAADAFEVDMAASLLVGDADSDISAADAAGVGRSRLFTGGALPSLGELFP